MEGKVARERISGCSVTHLEFWEIGGWRMEGERVVSMNLRSTDWNPKTLRAQKRAIASEDV